MNDRDPQFVFDGSALWTPQRGSEVIAAKDITQDELVETAQALEASLAPAPRQWIGDRLTVLASMFSMGRNAPDVGSVTIWLVEASRLLSDIPHDILAHSIDEAVRTRPHGFMPSVGEIRAIADPIRSKRGSQLFRIGLLLGRAGSAAGSVN